MLLPLQTPLRNYTYTSFRTIVMQIKGWSKNKNDNSLVSQLLFCFRIGQEHYMCTEVGGTFVFITV